MKRPSKRKPRALVGHYPAAMRVGDEPATPPSMEFGRRLQAAMIRKGWSQSELARRADAFLPEPTPGQRQGQRGIERDLVSHRVRGQHLPQPHYVEALAKALEVEPRDLLPPGLTGGAASTEPSPFAMKTLQDGRVSLHVNRTVSFKTAMKIMALFMEEDKDAP